MNNFLNQPWWVDVGVIALPILAIATAVYIIRKRACAECGHAATKWQRKWYCDRCFRKVFGEIKVSVAGMPVAPVPVAMPAKPATRGPKPRRKKAKPGKTRVHPEQRG
jgi:hypothetical protein